MPQVTGAITAVEGSFDGRAWYLPPIEVSVPARVAIRTTFEITAPDLVRVKNILTLTYGEEVSVFESEVGTVRSGVYFFQFALDFPMGLPGPVMGKSEILALLEEWETLDVWEGKLAEISYKLLGRILKVGRRVDEVLTPLPFSVPPEEEFLLGMEGLIQVPTPGAMILRAEIYPPTGEIISHELAEEIPQPGALTFSANLRLSGLRVPGIYTGRIGLFFDGTLLHTVEGRIFEVIGAPAPSPLVPLVGMAALFLPIALMGIVMKEVRRWEGLP